MVPWLLEVQDMDLCLSQRIFQLKRQSRSEILVTTDLYAMTETLIQ